MAKQLLWAAGILMVAVALAGCGKAGSKAAGSPAGAPPQSAASPGQGAPAAQGGADAQARQPGEASAAQSAAGSHKTYDAPPPMKIDTNKRYVATVSTDKGEFKIELFAKESPKAVNNFVFLAREGFYNGIKFHRIIKSFMIQTGDPKGDGTGGPGYTFEDELPPQHSYEPGIVAMANAGPNTNGSQFFICTGPECKNLDQMPNYTQFGKVVEGMDVVQRIADTPVKASPFGEVSMPEEDVRITAISIEER